jgi:hypothetical protein
MQSITKAENLINKLFPVEEEEMYSDESGSDEEKEEELVLVEAYNKQERKR